MREVFSASFLRAVYLFWIAMIMAVLVYPTITLATHEDEPMNCEGTLVDKFQEIDLIAKEQ
ncbi:MAG: hypothetical protein V3U71_00655 [Cocleimonas sp.]